MVTNKPDWLSSVSGCQPSRLNRSLLPCELKIGILDSAIIIFLKVSQNVAKLSHETAHNIQQVLQANLQLKLLLSLELAIHFAGDSILNTNNEIQKASFSTINGITYQLTSELGLILQGIADCRNSQLMKCSR